jgi:hypothetical protein
MLLYRNNEEQVVQQLAGLLHREYADRLRSWHSLKAKPEYLYTGRLPITQRLELAFSYAAVREVVREFTHQFDAELFLPPCLDTVDWFLNQTFPPLTHQQQQLFSEFTLDMGALMAAKLSTDKLRNQLLDTMGHMLTARTAMVNAEKHSQQISKELSQLTIALEHRENELVELRAIQHPRSVARHWQNNTSGVLEDMAQAFVLANKRYEIALKALLRTTHGDGEVVLENLHQAMHVLTCADVGLSSYTPLRYNAASRSLNPPIP